MERSMDFMNTQIISETLKDPNTRMGYFMEDQSGIGTTAVNSSVSLKMVIFTEL